MVMRRKEGDDKRKVKKLSRLHFYIILGIVALVVALGVLSEVNSYHKRNTKANEIPVSTTEQYVEFMDYHMKEFISTRDEAARYDEIYRAEPFVHRTEMDEYTEMLVALCDEAIDFPSPKDKELAKIHESYVQSMKDFRKAARMYPQAYEDNLLFNVSDDLIVAKDLFTISRSEFDAAVKEYESKR